MSRSVVALVLLAVTCTAAPALARKMLYRPAPAGPTERAATADLVVIGRVTAVEQGETEVGDSAGTTETTGYRVAVLQIEDPLTDAGGQTHVRIGYDPIGPNARPWRHEFRMREDAAGVFFLTRHPSGSFYLLTANSPPLETGENTYKEDLDRVKKTTRVLADPVTALKVAEAKDRYFAAAVLVQRYRTPAGDPSQTAHVPAEESRLILQALAEADWADAGKDAARPVDTFNRLGLTAQDKWQPAPADGNRDEARIQEEFKKWVEGDGKAYRVQRYARPR